MLLPYFLIWYFYTFLCFLNTTPLFILRLTRTVLKDLHDELQLAKLCEDPMMPISVDLREIENLVCELVSTENIISIH